MSQLTETQKVCYFEPKNGEIAAELIKQAPPGEFKEVVSDVRTIIGKDEILKASALTAFREYNESMFTPCKISKEHQSIVTKFGCTGDQYVDNRNKLLFSFDHIKQEGTETSKHELDSDLQPYFEAIDQELLEYTKEHYKSSNSGTYLSGTPTDLKIFVCLESHVYSPNNFWNGLLKSSFEVEAKSLTVKGLIDATIHYYEEGNVQLHATKDVNEKLKGFKDPKELATHIVAVIKSEEQKYQEAIVNDTTDLMDATFKALRRALPVTRTKIDWDKVAAYGLASHLNK